MGNFEKLVVLAVLFLSAIVLAVSLNGGGEVEATDGPLGAARARLDAAGGADGQALPGEGARSTEEAGGATDGRFYLSSEVSTEAEETGAPAGGAAAATAPTSQPARRDARGRLRILRSEAGLQSAGIDDYRIYVVSDGDTWSGLSERFYRGGRYVHLLRAANEELSELVAGERILVPVFDFAQDAGRRDPLPARATAGAAPVPSTRSATALGADPATSARANAADESPRALADLSEAASYVVQSGDSLTGISLRAYGTTKHWKRLYEANADVLKSPDWLEVGTRLALPRGAALTAPLASEPEAATSGGKVR